MTTGISVREVTPVQTGDAAVDQVSADVLVDGQGTGALLLLCAPIPDLAAAKPAAYVAQGAGAAGGSVYRLSVSYPGLWYVWAQDDLGTSEPAAGWVGLSMDRDLNLMGQWLADTLTAHKLGIEAALRVKFFPEVTIKCITYGSADSIVDFPAILVSKPREQAEWVALPLLREHVYSLEVALFLVHQSRASLLPVGVQFATTAMSILNKPEYESVVLASGTSVAFCQATSGDCNEAQIDENTWSTAGSVLWSGKALKQGGIA